MTVVQDRAAANVAAPLQVRRLGLEYPRPGGGAALRVLQDIELSLRPRTIVCVAGRSGSGKTSLLLVCSGFLRPTEGTVLWRSTPIEQLPANEVMRLRRGFLGVVFQHGALIPSLTAAENVALVRGADGRLVSGVAEAREALRRVGLDGRTDHFPVQLSGGEQQRVAIARALTGNPPVVVIDEPTASLDRNSADQIIKVVTDVRESGYAVLVASHDRHVIDAADLVISLD